MSTVDAGEYFEMTGVKVKKYRGMGSLEAMAKGSESRYGASCFPALLEMQDGGLRLRATYKPEDMAGHRYHSDTQSMKIAQGVAGTVKDKGSAQRNIPFLMQAARQGFQVCHHCICKTSAANHRPAGPLRRDLVVLQDMGARSIAAAHEMLANGAIYLETRTGAAQAEGNVHDMFSFDKVRW